VLDVGKKRFAIVEVSYVVLKRKRTLLRTL
jgi:hypothetical protein